MIALPASIVLTFFGSTGTYAQALPWGTGPAARFGLEWTGMHTLGVEAWGDHILSGSYDVQARIWQAWTVRTGRATVTTGRCARDLRLVGPLALAFDGELDFGGQSGRAYSERCHAQSFDCVGVVGNDVTIVARDFLVLSAGWRYTFEPSGVPAHAHVVVLTGQAWRATVAVE